jgi:hypothetical protein
MILCIHRQQDNIDKLHNETENKFRGVLKMLKFMYNGIKLNGELFKAWYSIGSTRGYAEGTITIYAKDYTSFPQVDGLQVQNNTDSMTDYFEKDRIRVTPDNKFYNEVLTAYNKQEEHRQNKINKRNGITEEVKKVEVIEEVKTEATTTQEIIKAEGITVEFNEEKKGIEITFATKELATEEIRNAIKSVGFRWFGKLGKWIARQNDETIALVNSLFVKAEEVTTDIKTIGEVVTVEESETYELVGSSVIGYWGAMHPYSYGTITSVKNDIVTIDFNDDEEYPEAFTTSLASLKTGSITEIGVYIVETKKTIETPQESNIDNNIKNETIDNTKLIIFIEGEGCVQELTTNSIIKATENLNARIMNEYKEDLGGCSKTWITLIINGESSRFRYDISNKTRLATNIIKFMLDEEQSEFNYTMNNIEKFVYMNAEEYEKGKLECIEFLNNLLVDNSREIVIKDDPYQRALNTIENNNLYEIEADSKAVIVDNRYIKNVYCNGLTVVTGLTIKELIQEGRGVDILHLKPLKMPLDIFMEGIKKHDLKQIRTLFPTATDKALENIIFIDRLQNELSRANINELVTV